MTDKELFEILKEKSDYEVVVDNDSVWIENENGEYVDTFYDFGYHLLVKIFNYVGINARHC